MSIAGARPPRSTASRRRCVFETAEELAAQPKLADAAINGTMDRLHIPTSLPLLKAGYHLLLEKPIAPSAAEVLLLQETARKHDRKVMICHVLRYAPFYAAVRQRVADGEIGDIISVQTQENVSYHHMAVGFIRGKWRREDQSNSMLMAKRCHDMDLITWMKSGIAPKKVSSFGCLTQFKPENAPEGSGKRCLADCMIEATCPYSARKNYIEQGLWRFYAWESVEHLDLDEAGKLESLRTDNPYGRFVWHCDNDVVDHQSVIVEFADGSTATHNMVGATSRPCRSIHLIGTKGEIQGVLEDGFFVVRHMDARAGHEYSEERVEINVSGDGFSMYPGPTPSQPLSSIRLENMRDGEEDYEYFLILDRLIAQAEKTGRNPTPLAQAKSVRDEARKLVASMTEYPKSGAPYAAIREKVGGAIESLIR